MSRLPAEKLEEIVTNLKAGAHPLGKAFKVDKETGEVVEKILGYEVWDDNSDPDLLMVKYTLGKKYGEGTGKWMPYDKVILLEKPAYTSRVQTMLLNGGFPYGLVDDVLRATDLTKRPIELVRGFLDDSGTYVYTMAGECGVGKTFAATWGVVQMLRERKAHSCGFVKAADVDGYMETDNDSYLPVVPDRDVDVLVIDDFCAEIVTSVIKDQLTRLVDFRIDRRLPTIMTTNIQDVEVIQELYGDRLFSRIAGRSCSRMQILAAGGKVEEFQGSEEEEGREGVKEKREIAVGDDFELSI